MGREGASDLAGSDSEEQRAVLKSMHAEEDAKYTESRSLSTRFVRSLLRSSSSVRSFVRWFFERSFPHHRSIDTVTIFDECGRRTATEGVMSVGAGDLETSNRYTGVGSGLQALGSEDDVKKIAAQ